METGDREAGLSTLREVTVHFLHVSVSEEGWGDTGPRGTSLLLSDGL